MNTSLAAAIAHFNDPLADVVEYQHPGDADAWWLNEHTGELYPRNDAAAAFWGRSTRKSKHLTNK